MYNFLLICVIGIPLAMLITSFGVTGSSLPRDQIGYWACKIVTGIPEGIPIIGGSVVQNLRGGLSVGPLT